MIESPYLIAALAIFLHMCAFFLIGTYLKNNGIVDVGWGLGFAVVATTLFFWFEAFSPIQLLLYFSVLIWALRLSLFLGKRNIGKAEDFRYANWRKEWGKWVVPRAFLQVYMLQGSIMFVVALPIIHALGLSAGNELQWFQVLGFLLFLIGFMFETVADAQKDAFRKSRTDRESFIQSGLWRFSRHPNYFGEAILWWGIFLMSLPLGIWQLSLISPLLISWLLLRVSGIPMLEAKYDENAAYQVYKLRTSAFIPLPPKES